MNTIVLHLDDETSAALERLARDRSASVEDIVRDMVAREAQPTLITDPAERAALLREIRSMTPAGAQSDSVEMLRELRDRHALDT